MPSAERAD